VKKSSRLAQNFSERGVDSARARWPSLSARGGLKSALLRFRRVQALLSPAIWDSRFYYLRWLL